MTGPVQERTIIPTRQAAQQLVVSSYIMTLMLPSLALKSRVVCLTWLGMGMAAFRVSALRHTG